MLVNLSAPFAHAEDRPWHDQDFKPWYIKVYDPENPTEIFGERYTAAQVQWVIYGFVSMLINFVVQDRELSYCVMATDRGHIFLPGSGASGCLEEIAGFLEDLFTYNQQDQNQVYANRGSTFRAITTLPVSSLEYFRDIKQRLNFVSPAEAQTTGFGFTAATPVLAIWRLVRNVTYALLVIVMIVMAFMIMFRVKLSPQTVISVQSALPKVILTLILITFSYAIAGLMIDLMYVVIGLLAGILTSGATPLSNLTWSDMFAHLTQGSVFGYLTAYFGIFFVSITNLVMSDNSPIAQMIGEDGAKLVGLILLAIVLVFLFIIFVKIVWLMVKTYALILIQIIIGPVQILLGTVSGGGFSKWLMKLVSLLAVYPAVSFMLVVSFVFLRASLPTLPELPPPLDPNDILTNSLPFEINNIFTGSGEPWGPPLTINAVQAPDSPLLLWLGASLVILSMIPKAAELMQAVFMGGRMPRMSTALGQAVGIATTPITYPLSRTVGGISKAAEAGLAEKIKISSAVDFVNRSIRRRP